MQSEYYLSGILFFKELEIFNYFISGMDRNSSNINVSDMSIKFDWQDDESNYTNVSSGEIFNRLEEAFSLGNVLMDNSMLVGYSESSDFEIITVFSGKFKLFSGTDGIESYLGAFRFYNLFKDKAEFNKLYEEFMFDDTKLGEMRELVEQDQKDIIK